MVTAQQTPGLIGRKIGMMTVFDASGRARGVTAIEVTGNRITQIRTQDRDGYEAIQVGAPGKRNRINKPEQGHLSKSGTESLSELRECRVLESNSFEVGQEIGADQFESGTFVNVTGITKGRGFAGVVRRWNFRGGPKTHGQSDRHRAPGSIGAGTTPGRVWKGQKMAGHMGNKRRTSLNLLVVYSNPDRQLIFVQGAVPGPRNGIVILAQGRRNPLADYAPPVFNLDQLTEVEIESDLQNDVIEQDHVEEKVDDVIAEEVIEEISDPSTEEDSAEQDHVEEKVNDVTTEEVIEEISDPSTEEDSA